MTRNSEPELDAFVARGRRAQTPTDEDKHRIRLATLAAVAGPRIPREENTPEDVDDDDHDARRSGLLSLLRPALFAIALAATAALSYELGRHAERARADGREHAVTPSAPVAPAVVQSPSPPIVSAEAPVNRRTGAPQATSSNARNPGPDHGDALDAEVRALSHIERALRDDNPRLAAELLEELDESLPHGRLMEERDAARVVARCAMDRSTEARAFADRFAARYPASVYVKRVAQACR